MEILPINPDEMLKPRPVHPFGAVHLKKCVLPESAHSTYRVMLDDGTHRDVVAEHAREAYLMIQQEASASSLRPVHIYHLRYLTEDVIPATRIHGASSEIRVEIEDARTDHGHLMVEIPPKPAQEFEVMEYDDLALLYASEPALLEAPHETPSEPCLEQATIPDKETSAHE